MLGRERELQKVYLTAQDWDPNKEFCPFDEQTLLQDGLVYSPEFLADGLVAARDCLVNTPGSNRFVREISGESWLNWWIGFLLNFRDRQLCSPYPVRKANNVVPFFKLKDIVWEKRNSANFGVWFVANHEGGIGHRFSTIEFLNSSLEYVALVMEQEEYTKRFKARGGSYLHLGMRLSMWSYFFHILVKGEKV